MWWGVFWDGDLTMVVISPRESLGNGAVAQGIRSSPQKGSVAVL